MSFPNNVKYMASHVSSKVLQNRIVAAFFV